MKVPFSESQATWNEASSGVSWQSAGASGTNDRESTDIGYVLIPENQALDVEKQIPLSISKIQEMVNGTFTNNGFIIIADTETNDRFSYRTSDASAATKRPKLVIEYSTSSSTPTNTPTPGPSPTPTNTLTPSATPAGTNTPTPTAPVAFNNATFVYDGDGKRVKSTFNGTTTTYFVGTHYEVTGSTITKYYYAGAQRIAMRTNGTLNYLLGAHLGSTSLVTNATGQNPIETRYKAWGETRYASGSTPTKYTYTGQYSYTPDFGLMFYNARWYDPSLGRFVQADIIIPGGAQGLDRYAYVNNSPLNYVDPTGHSAGPATHDSYGDSASYFVAILAVNLASSLPSGIPGAQYYNYNGHTYNNLCGHVSLSMIYETMTGERDSLPYFIENLNNWDSESNGDSGTGAGDLGLLLQATFPDRSYATYRQGRSVVSFGTDGSYNPSALENNWWIGADGQSTMKTQLAGMISNGDYLVIGVYLDSATGQIVPNGGIPHWVVLAGIAGNTAIINDPFDNQTEYYDWNLIESSIINSLGTVIQIHRETIREEEYGGRK